MELGFSGLDWAVFGGYFLLLWLSGYYLGRQKIDSASELFLANRSIPFWAAALSLLATSQSAATFLGGPEFSFKHNLTFVGFYLSALLAAWIVARFLIPKLYSIGAQSVYDLIGHRYGQQAAWDSALLFVVGRLLASGARLYIGALAVSMVIFLDINPWHLLISATLLVAGGLLYAFFGGIKGVIYSDIIQALTYVGAAVAMGWFLWIELGIDGGSFIQKLDKAEHLKLLDLSLGGNFSLYALLSGWLLLNIGAFGLDQDMMQRTLSCKDASEASRSMLWGVGLSLVVALLFMFLGLELYLYYNGSEVAKSHKFQGQSVTIMLYFILNEMPSGLKGFVTVGAIAAALSSTNSALSALSSVAYQNLYLPKNQHPTNPVAVGRIMMVVFALLLIAIAMLCFYWQQATSLPLVSFALGVMAFGYSGLLGVYAVALFTQRGGQASVRASLIGGFAFLVAMQPYVGDRLWGWHLDFSWAMLSGSLVAFAIMLLWPKQA